MIEFIFCEFYSPFKVNRQNILRFFPEAAITEYSEHNTDIIFPEHDTRRLWKMGDYADWTNILKSNADVAISMDADLLIVSEKARAILPLVQKFGFCVAASGRYTVEVDTRIGTGSDGKLDDSLGQGYAVCNGFFACNPKLERVKRFFECAARLKLEQQARGPLTFWRAMWETGIYPYILPQQWCVCADKVGIGGEIILHTKDKEIKDFYGKKYNLADGSRR
jgi:hypothetical protein